MSALIEQKMEWGSKIAWLIIIATAWCVKLEYTVSGLKAESDARQINIERSREARSVEMTDIKVQIAKDSIDLDWLKRELRLHGGNE